MKSSTTASLTTSSHAESKQKRSRVEHYWWISDGEAARSLGILEVPSICRRAWVNIEDGDLLVAVKQTESGDLTDDGAVDACKVCEGMMYAATRRHLRDRDRA